MRYVIACVAVFLVLPRPALAVDELPYALGAIGHATGNTIDQMIHYEFQKQQMEMQRKTQHHPPQPVRTSSPHNDRYEQMYIALKKQMNDDFKWQMETLNRHLEFIDDLYKGLKAVRIRDDNYSAHHKEQMEKYMAVVNDQMNTFSKFITAMREEIEFMRLIILEQQLEHNAYKAKQPSGGTR